uniref:Uncharacterized protein n=1 Tax=Heterosigma akashiwo TaxID=2829 RepID=A0A7S4D7V0_HETAK
MLKCHVDDKIMLLELIVDLMWTTWNWDWGSPFYPGSKTVYYLLYLLVKRSSVRTWLLIRYWFPPLKKRRKTLQERRTTKFSVRRHLCPAVRHTARLRLRSKKRWLFGRCRATSNFNMVATCSSYSFLGQSNIECDVITLLAAVYRLWFILWLTCISCVRAWWQRPSASYRVLQNGVVVEPSLLHTNSAIHAVPLQHHHMQGHFPMWLFIKTLSLPLQLGFSWCWSRRPFCARGNPTSLSLAVRDRVTAPAAAGVLSSLAIQDGGAAASPSPSLPSEGGGAPPAVDRAGSLSLAVGDSASAPPGASPIPSLGSEGGAAAAPPAGRLLSSVPSEGGSSVAILSPPSLASEGGGGAPPAVVDAASLSLGVGHSVSAPPGASPISSLGSEGGAAAAPAAGRLLSSVPSEVGSLVAILSPPSLASEGGGASPIVEEHLCCGTVCCISLP